MKLNLLLISFFILLFTACSTKPLEPIVFNEIEKSVSFSKEIKPILDKRCVSCHSCYNSACQLKLSSYEGLQRGASKINVYENRLQAINPTRLFIDGVSTRQWREKGFVSVLDGINEKNESIMMHMLNQKMKHPTSTGKYAPEMDKLVCAKNQTELEEYFEENPHKGMPYGFPALKQNEYDKIQTWLVQGAKDDTKQVKIPLNETELIEKFEKFLNNKEIKHQVTARYIYEHLFLAHISFDKNSSNFFELVRSKTPTGKPVKIIATQFPFSEINEPFYYRFRIIESTLVHKTHMVYELSLEKLARYEELFIKPSWDILPHMPSYEHSIASNALKAYEQIPAQNRYQFLLDDIHYIIMTFIRGPVCKGQIALNVIQDHFWVMFLDPKFDASLRDKYFLHDNISNLYIPNEEGNNPGILKTFNILRDYSYIKNYFDNKAFLYKQYYPNGVPLEAIWKGNQEKENDAILTVYRHFDSASVHKGALGNIPKTLWVIDYALVERLYYSLVAGFDIFGNTAHQLLVRKYMDVLRIEGEHNFLSFLPKNSRKNYFKEWYDGWDISYEDIYSNDEQDSSITFKTHTVKEEFAQMILKYTNAPKDSINYIQEGYQPTPIKESYSSLLDIEESFKALSLPNALQVIQNFADNNSNLAYIKIEMNSGENYVYSMVINKWLYNVAFLFDEEDRRDTTKDNVDFIRGFIGSYPNIFAVVKQNDLPEFFRLIQNYQNDNEHNRLLLKFFINRANPNFWDVLDWFNEAFKQQNSLTYGLFDINRYFPTALTEETINAKQ